MKRCNSCQSIQDDTNRFCTRCGFNQFTSLDGPSPFANYNAYSKVGSAQNSRKRRKAFLAAGIVFAVAIFALIVAFAFENPVDYVVRGVQNDRIQDLVDEARLYTARNDYVGALDFLDSSILTYPDELRLQQERSNCLSEYETYVADESLRLANAGEFQHALSLAKSGLNYFTSTKVTELVAIYKSHIPVILGEMEMFQNKTEGGSWVTKTNEIDKYLEDNYGNVYANSLSVGCGFVTYLVNFKYQTFSGTVAFPKGLESDGYRESATLQVYGDDVKIAEFSNFNEATKPESFSLNIASFEKITLKWSCKGMNIWGDWGYFATIFDGELIPVALDLPAES